MDRAQLDSWVKSLEHDLAPSSVQPEPAPAGAVTGSAVASNAQPGAAVAVSAPLSSDAATAPTSASAASSAADAAADAARVAAQAASAARAAAAEKKSAARAAREALQQFMSNMAGQGAPPVQPPPAQPPPVQPPPPAPPPAPPPPVDNNSGAALQGLAHSQGTLAGHLAGHQLQVIPPQQEAWQASGPAGMMSWPQMLPQDGWGNQAMPGSSSSALVPAAFANQQKPKVPSAFANAQAAKKALNAREPGELFTGKVMNAFQMMTCQMLARPVPQTQMAGRMDTIAMDGLLCRALGGTAQSATSAMEEMQKQQASAGPPTPASMSPEQQMQMMQMMQQYMMMQQQQQFTQAAEGAAEPAPAGAAASGQAGERSEQDAAVFDAVFAAQQAQHMQQMQFVHSMRNQGTSQSLIGSPTGPLMECRFTDDFRPLQYCKRFFSAEGCRRAAQCTYAHCPDELHPNSPECPKQNEMGVVEEEPEFDAVKSMPDMRMKKKREICNKWKKDGGCVLGQACPFAHGEKEIGTVALVVCEKVKMKICGFWERGKCVYGKSCINAHGKEEIGLKRPDFMHNAPQGKKRGAGESVEAWRNTVIKTSIFG